MMTVRLANFAPAFIPFKRTWAILQEPKRRRPAMQGSSSITTALRCAAAARWGRSFAEESKQGLRDKLGIPTLIGVPRTGMIETFKLSPPDIRDDCFQDSEGTSSKPPAHRHRGSRKPAERLLLEEPVKRSIPDVLILLPDNRK
jgi:hypothetical protein